MGDAHESRIPVFEQLETRTRLATDAGLSCLVDPYVRPLDVQVEASSSSDPAGAVSKWGQETRQLWLDPLDRTRINADDVPSACGPIGPTLLPRCSVVVLMGGGAE